MFTRFMVRFSKWPVKHSIMFLEKNLKHHIVLIAHLIIGWFPSLSFCPKLSTYLAKDFYGNEQICDYFSQLQSFALFYFWLLVRKIVRELPTSAGWWIYWGGVTRTVHDCDNPQPYPPTHTPPHMDGILNKLFAMI